MNYFLLFTLRLLLFRYSKLINYNRQLRTEAIVGIKSKVSILAGIHYHESDV